MNEKIRAYHENKSKFFSLPLTGYLYYNQPEQGSVRLIRTLD